MKPETYTAGECGAQLAKVLLDEAVSRCDPTEINFMLYQMNVNIVGNIDSKTWEIMNRNRPQPCGEPGCQCHVLANRLIDVLADLRKDHQIVIQARKGKN